MRPGSKPTGRDIDLASRGYRVFFRINLFMAIRSDRLIASSGNIRIDHGPRPEQIPNSEPCTRFSLRRPGPLTCYFLLRYVSKAMIHPTKVQDDLLFS